MTSSKFGFPQELRGKKLTGVFADPQCVALASMIIAFGDGANTWLSFRATDLVEYWQLAKKEPLPVTDVEGALKKLHAMTSVPVGSEPVRSPLARSVPVQFLRQDAEGFYRVCDDFVRVCRRIPIS